MIKKITIKIISLMVISIGLIGIADLFLTNHESKDMQITKKSTTGRGGGTKNIFLKNKKYIVTNKIFNNTQEGDIVSIKFAKLSKPPINLHSLTNKKIHYRNFGLNALASILFSLFFIVIGFIWFMGGEEFDLIWVVVATFACIQLSHFL